MKIVHIKVDGRSEEYSFICNKKKLLFAALGIKACVRIEWHTAN
jgi:hypothetical protein